MLELYKECILLIKANKYIFMGIFFVSLPFFVWLFRFVIRKISFYMMKENYEHVHRSLIQQKFFRYVALIVSTLLIYKLTKILPNDISSVLDRFLNIIVIIQILLLSNKTLMFINEFYKYSDSAKKKPLKGYIQLLKILFYLIAFILIIAELVNKSPLYLLSGLGALTAVLMLVFKDTLLSFVAGIHLASNNLLEPGDRIEFKEQDADGIVTDIALYHIKIQNWDKTITVVPTQKFLYNSFLNWREIIDNKHRRVKKSFPINPKSIQILSEDNLIQLRLNSITSHFIMKHPYLKQSQSDEKSKLQNYNNIKIFREFILDYLTNHEKIRKDFPLYVHYLSITAQEGIPLELYAFTDETDIIPYENLQSEIIEYTYAMMPYFNLEPLVRVNHENSL